MMQPERLARRLTIGGRVVEERHPLLVAEVASAHEGRVEDALALVRAIAASGGEAIKFQLVIADELVVPDHPQAALFRSLELGRDGWRRLVEAARHAGLIPMADVFGERSLALAIELGVAALKIPSAGSSDAELIARVAACKLPTCLSAAGASEEELDWAVQVFRRVGHDALVLLHGFQAFPTPPGAIQLRRLTWLRERFGCAVGLSEHSAGETPLAHQLPLVGVGLGAIILEKHVTLDRSRKGLDWVSALEPEEFGALRRSLAAVAEALGSVDGAWRPGELAYRRAMRRRLVLRRAVEAGEPLSAAHVMLRRTAAPSAIDPCFLEQVLGRSVSASLPAGAALTWPRVDGGAVAIVIAARLNSTRLPRKALADLGGRAVLERLIERLSLSRYGDRIVLCTSTHPDDAALAALAEQLGVGVVRGDEDDVMARFLQAAAQTKADLIVRVTGDNPLTDPEVMDRMIDAHRQQQVEYTYTEDLPFGTRCEVISVAALRRVHELAEDPRRSEYMTWYLQQPGAARSLRYRVEDPRLVRPHYRLTLDTAEDLQLLQEVFARLGEATSGRPLREIVALLDGHPELVALNAAVPQRMAREQVNTHLRNPQEPIALRGTASTEERG
jgi:N,N'-diacetyllegionaminate synthase